MVRLHSVFTALAVLIITTSIAHAQYWNPANGGLALPVTSLAINGAGDMFGVVPDIGLYRSTDLGLSWTPLPNPNGYTLDHVWCINGLGHIFAVAGWQEFRSSNNGDSWTPIRIEPLMSFDPVINGWTFTKAGRMFVSTKGSTGLYTTVDDGGHWYEQGVFGNSLNPTYVACGPRGTVFGTSATMVDTARTALASAWDPLVNVPSGGFGNNITFAFNPSAAIVVAGSNGVFYSSDNGDSWTASIDQEDGASTYCVAIAPNGYIFEGANSIFGGPSGLKRSTNAGTTWDAITGGLKSTQVYALAFNWTGYLYAATDSGVFRYVDPVGDVKPVAGAVPSSFALEQNYPNPVASSSTIRFSLPEPAPVSLRVYDMAGRELASLACGNYPAGTYNVSFDARGLTSGAYYYQLQAGAFQQARTFVVAP